MQQGVTVIQLGAYINATISRSKRSSGTAGKSGRTPGRAIGLDSVNVYGAKCQSGTIANDRCHLEYFQNISLEFTEFTETVNAEDTDN